MKQNLFKKSTTILFLLLVGTFFASGWGKPNDVEAQASKSPSGSIVALNTDSTANDNAVVTIEASQSIQYTAFKLLNPLRLVLDFPNMQKGNLSGIMQVNKGVVQSIRPLHFEEAGVLRLEIALNKTADYEIIKPTQKTMTIRLDSAVMEMARGTGETVSSKTKGIKKAKKEDLKDAALILDEAVKISDDSCYPMLHGKKEPITLDFQGEDIRNLIRIFADISGFNIILSPGLTGTVNMRMKDVPWNEAMEVILANNALGRECLGKNIVRVATKATLAAEEAGRTAKKARIATDLATQRNAQDLVTEVVRVNNADITELSAALNALKSTRVDARITVDTRTNTIILNDLRQYVDDMLETIRVLDIATAQVLIEAKIVEISKSFAQELGVQWGFTGTLAQGNATTNGVAGSSIELGAASTATAGGFLVDLGQTANIAAKSVSGFGLTLGSIAKGISVATQLEALETQGKGRILSSPKVTTADNKEARITSGRQIPYQTVSTDGTTTEFVDAELSMTVVPHVTFDGQVYMTIDTTNNAADFSNTVTGNNIPTITTKATHNEVLVGNGDTTVLGGIYTSNVVENKKAVPFFSKIPFLGVLFRSFNESDTINELLIFVTPTIVDNGYN
ncbi:MAG: type IV pilus secretin PilQ [Nitrospinae bacterium]|nr:type IV pilus secretin PilQ [Nitrospinota bacterium]